MSEFYNFAEYTVTKKYEGRYGLKRKLAIAAYIITPILLLFGMLFVMGAAAFIWFVPLCPVFLLIIVRTTYNRFFKIEFDYQISGGTFTVSQVYNGKSRSEWLSAEISKMEMIAPYRDKYKNTADRMNISGCYEAASSMKAEDLYFAIIPEETNHTKSILFFEPTEKMLKLLRACNRATVVVPVKY